MAPKGKAKVAPTGDLRRQIDRDFGGLEAFQAHFQAAAATVEGNGWGALVWSPGAQRLFVCAFRNHQDQMVAGAVPLLLCDVWEHAYYLKYRNQRRAYLANWWNVVDWADVERRFAWARR
jgi:Fe-Mn family superoxide dismutase